MCAHSLNLLSTIGTFGTAKAVPYVSGCVKAAPYVLRRSVNHRRSATVLLTGADVGASRLLGYAIAHALLILPIWTQLLRGLPFAPVAEVTFR